MPDAKQPMRDWRMRNSRRPRREQAGRRGWGARLFLLLAAACAEPRQPWPVFEPPPPAELDLSLPLPSDLPLDGGIPSALDYPDPHGARPWLTGRSDPAPVGRRLSALAAAKSEGRALSGALDLDVDGDGRGELLVLSRARDGAYHVELYAPDREEALARHRIAPVLRGGRPCHLEVRLLGALRTAAGERPLIWRDRGVGCARFEGGGYERHLLLLVPGREALVEVPIARRRHLGHGATDAYEAAVWRAGRPGEEVLYLRGIFASHRACAHPDAGYWVEELAYRRLEADGAITAWRKERILPLPEGILPPELLRSHMAPCR